MTEQFKDRITHYTTRVENHLGAALPKQSVSPRQLHEAMRYAVLSGGKRVRPLLVYATGECLQIDANRLDAPAVAIELIHAFSLVHDDLPAMDDDDLRRGQPTLHRRYDEATAILAADALQPLAFFVLSDMSGIDAEKRIELVRLIANACGSTGMTGGQALDLAAEGEKLPRSDLEHLYALKTGALIHASIMSASILHDSLATRHKDALDTFARSIGIAFQIKDDLLDVEGKTEVIGKPAGSDERSHKATYPSLFGVTAARKRCNELLEQALQCLTTFGAAGKSLEWLARYIVERRI